MPDKENDPREAVLNQGINAEQNYAQLMVQLLEVTGQKNPEYGAEVVKRAARANPSIAAQAPQLPASIAAEVANQRATEDPSQSFVKAATANTVAGLISTPFGLVDLATQILPGESTELSKGIHEALEGPYWTKYDPAPSPGAKSAGEFIGEMSAALFPTIIGTKLFASVAPKIGTWLGELKAARPALGRAAETVIVSKLAPSVPRLGQHAAEAVTFEATTAEPDWGGVATWMVFDAALRSRAAVRLKDRIFTGAIEKRGPLTQVWDLMQGRWLRESDVTGMEPALIEALGAATGMTETSIDDGARLFFGTPFQHRIMDVETAIAETSRTGGAEFTTFIFKEGKEETIKSVGDVIRLSERLLAGEEISKVIGSKRSINRFRQEFLAQHPKQIEDLLTLGNNIDRKIKDSFVVVRDTSSNRKFKASLRNRKQWHRRGEFYREFGDTGKTGAAFEPSSNFTLAEGLKTGRFEIIGMTNATKENVGTFIGSVYGKKHFLAERLEGIYVFESSTPKIHLESTKTFRDETYKIREVFELERDPSGIYKVPEAAKNKIINGSKVIEVGVRDLDDLASRQHIWNDIRTSGALKDFQKEVRASTAPKTGEGVEGGPKTPDEVVQKGPVKVETEEGIVEGVVVGEAGIHPETKEVLVKVEGIAEPVPLSKVRYPDGNPYTRPFEVADTVFMESTGPEIPILDNWTKFILKRMGGTRAQKAAVRQKVRDTLEALVRGDEIDDTMQIMLRDYIAPGMAGKTGSDLIDNTVKLILSKEAIGIIGFREALLSAYMYQALPREITERIALNLKFRSGFGQGATATVHANQKFADKVSATVKLFQDGDHEAFLHEIGHVVAPMLPDDVWNNFRIWAEAKYGTSVAVQEVFADVFATIAQKKAFKTMPKQLREIGIFQKAAEYVRLFLDNVRSMLGVESGPKSIEKLYDDLAAGVQKLDVNVNKTQSYLSELITDAGFGKDTYPNRLFKSEKRLTKLFGETFGIDLRSVAPQSDAVLDFPTITLNLNKTPKGAARSNIEEAIHKIREAIIPNSINDSTSKAYKLSDDVTLQMTRSQRTLRLSVTAKNLDPYGPKENIYSIAVAKYGEDVVEIDYNTLTEAIITSNRKRLVIDGLPIVDPNPKRGEKLINFMKSHTNDQFKKRAAFINNNLARILPLEELNKITYAFKDDKLVVRIPRNVRMLVEESPFTLEQIAKGIGANTKSKIMTGEAFYNLVRTLGWKGTKLDNNFKKLMTVSLGHRDVKVKLKGGGVHPLGISGKIHAEGIGWFIAEVRAKGLDIERIEAGSIDDVLGLFSQLEKTKVPLFIVHDKNMKTTGFAWFLRKTKDGIEDGHTVIYTDNLYDETGNLPLEILQMTQKGEWKLQSIASGAMVKEEEMSKVVKNLAAAQREYMNRVGKDPLNTVYDLARERGYSVNRIAGDEGVWLIPNTGHDPIRFDTIEELEAAVRKIDPPDVVATNEVERGVVEGAIADAYGGKRTRVEETAKKVSTAPGDTPRVGVHLKDGKEGLKILGQNLGRLMEGWYLPMRSLSQMVENKSKGAHAIFSKFYDPLHESRARIIEEVTAMLKPIADMVSKLSPDDERKIIRLLNFGYGMDKTKMTKNEIDDLASLLKEYSFTSEQKNTAGRLMNFFEDYWYSEGSLVAAESKMTRLYHPFRQRRVPQDIPIQPGEIKVEPRKIRQAPGDAFNPHAQERLGIGVGLEWEYSLKQTLASYAFNMKRAKYQAEPLNGLRKFIAQLEKRNAETGLEGIDLVALQTARSLHQSYIKRTGLPETMLMNAIEEGLFRVVGSGVRTDKWIRNTIRWGYLASLGFRPSTALKNATQVPLVLYPIVGKKHLTEGFKLYKAIKTDESHPLRNVIDAIYTPWMKHVEDGQSEVLEKLIEEGIPQKVAQKIFKSGMGMMHGVERMNRSVSFLSGWSQSGEILDRLAAGEGLAKVISSTPLGFFDTPVRNKLLRALELNPTEFRKMYSYEITMSTQWAYGTGEAGIVGNNKWGRALFMFGTWPINYGAYLRRLFMSSVDFSTGKPAMSEFGRRAMTRWVAAHTAMVGATSAAGVSMSGTAFFSPLGYTGGPYLQMATDAYDAIRLRGHEKELPKRRLARGFVRMSVPGYYTGRDVLQVIEYLADENYADAARRPFATPISRIKKAEGK